MKIWPVSKIKRVANDFLRDPIAYVSSCLAFLFLIIREKRLGIETHGCFSLEDHVALCDDASVYAATSYSRLDRMVDYLKLSREDTFIDLGCGAGRPVFFVGTRRLKKVVGIEIRKELADLAGKNLRNLKLNRTPIEIVHADASAYDVKEGTVFFMFNPFGEKTLAQVIENIKKSLDINPRKVRIAYYCPAHKDLLAAQDWLILEGEIGKTDIFVWRSRSS
jgi:precorrin-6B methylase 2